MGLWDLLWTGSLGVVNLDLFLAIHVYAKLLVDLAQLTGKPYKLERTVFHFCLENLLATAYSSYTVSVVW